MESRILHEVNGYYVTNEGTKAKPNYHVWIPGITCAYCDSAYADLSLAITRCNYMEKTYGKTYFNVKIHNQKL